MDDAGQLDELNSEVLAAVADLDSRLQHFDRQLGEVQARLEAERRRLSAAIDELSLRFMGKTPGPGAAGDAASAEAEGGGRRFNLEAIRSTERALSEQLLKCVTFGAKLHNLANLLLVSRSQFAPQGEASAELDVWKLVARTASIKAQEEERSRLAREVHDGPAQVLANAILGLELCEQIARRSPEQLLDELDRLKATAREGLAEVRRFIFDLRPSTLAERGLVATLQRYIAEYQNFFKLQVDLVVPSDLPTLTQEQEITIFRVVQESLQNVQKHARATTVSVRLEVNLDAIVVTIQDNGRGFTPKQTEITVLSGAGLGGMHERAAAAAGELHVESQPGAGTTVRLTLPRTTSEETPLSPNPLPNSPAR